ncbi:MotA/TolQ/ExbB proton channel family protein [Neisseriaceae bacterium JH1-16]|nr:MotA/TolQ/ExbB proton channel family protein [Neisseriaceae bacterium JH1-16]
MNLLTVFHQGDSVLVTVFLLLIAMSIATWYLILMRGMNAWRVRQGNRQAEQAVWAAPDWKSAESAVADSDAPIAALARQGLAAVRHYHANAHKGLGDSCTLDVFLTRAIRKGLAQQTGRLESGLTLLASVGSTAPFVGLFGTVWGIYNALVHIGAQGQVSIGTVSGPIGEALVATAAGLAAAIPAVLAYNALTRSNRVIGQELDHFAHDLHAHLLTAPEAGHGVR